MTILTKNRPFKMPRVHLEGFFIGWLYRDGKAPETELPPRNGSGA